MTTITTNVWVSWNGTARSHLAVVGVRPTDVTNGDFPLECGRWAPSGFDRAVHSSYARRCARCADAADRRRT